MTTERNAQGVDGLAEVMELIREATPGPWETASSCEYATHWEVCDCGGAFEPDGKTKVIAVVQDYCTAAEGDAAAIAAAVNYLRSHGEAIRELVEADREYDAAMAQRARIDGGTRFIDAKRRRAAALAKFPEPRP